MFASAPGVGNKPVLPCTGAAALEHNRGVRELNALTFSWD